MILGAWPSRWRRARDSSGDSSTKRNCLPIVTPMISRIINEPFSLCKDNFAFHILLGPRHSIRTVCRDAIQAVCGRQIKRITDLRRTRIKRRIQDRFLRFKI